MPQRIYKTGPEAANAMQNEPLEQQKLHDFVMGTVFSDNPPMSKEEKEWKTPYRQIGEKVQFYDPRSAAFDYRQNKKFRTDGDFEIVGFYDDDGNLREDKNPFTEEQLLTRGRPLNLRLRSSSRKNDIFDAPETSLVGYNYKMREPKK